jgi:hypothetical protein
MYVGPYEGWRTLSREDIQVMIAALHQERQAYYYYFSIWYIYTV